MTGSTPDAGTNVTMSDLHSLVAPRGRVRQNQTDWFRLAQPGLVAGTRVLTADGDLPVELLGPGDRIITRNTGLVRLVALHFHQCRGDFVQIKAGALGDTRPETDTILAADQTVLVRGNAALALAGQASWLVRASDLPDIAGKSVLSGIEMTVVQMVFDTAQLVYADGLETLCVPARENSLAA